MLIDNLNYSLKDKVIFDNASIHLKNNSLNFIIGENGVGKSTLLRLLIKEWSNGKILNKGSKIKRTDIFYQESEREFLPRVTGKEYLNFRNSLIKRNIDSYEDIEKLFNISLKSYVYKFSTGMKKKIEFIPSLFKKYKIYVFDEPLNGLDFESKEIIKDLLNSFVSNESIILIATHDLDYVDNNIDNTFLIKKGKIEKVNNTNYLRDKIKNMKDLKIEDFYKKD